MVSPQFGAPETTGVTITGRVATPSGSCFSDACDNPSITDGKPLPLATALFYGGDSGQLKIQGETGCDGSFEVNAGEEGSYVLYAVRNTSEGKYVVVKKGINGSSGDVGEANAYTTSQVIIWERANALYGENFTPFDASWYAQYSWGWSFDPAKLVLPVSEIPNLQPTAQLYNAVEKALSECRDPQGDSDVIYYANQIADATFGAPGGGAGGGGGGGGGAANRSFAVTKTVDKNTISVGQTATYTVVVTNTGNQPLNPTVSDDKFTLPTPVESGSSNGTLDVGETWTYTYSYTPTQIPTPNPLVNTVTVSVSGLDPQTAQARVTVVEEPCVQASISDFTVTSQCICNYQLQSRCTDCQNCKECTITISNVITSGTNIKYRYGYKKSGSTDYNMLDDWTSNSNYTFADIEECSSSTYDVIVQVKSDCSTSEYDDSLTKQVNLAGGECEKECEECSRNDANNCYEITSSSSYSNSSNQTTFTYTVKEKSNSSECKDISHWVLDFGETILKDKIVSISDNGVYTGKKEPTGVGKDKGIKWEVGGDFSQGTFTVKIEGCIEATSGNNSAGKIKAGQNIFDLNVCQPDL